MATLHLMKYDERIDDNHQGVIVFVPQSLQKPGKSRFQLESLGTARRQTRKELLGNKTTNNAVGHQLHSSQQAHENLVGNEKLIQPRIPAVNVNLPTINNLHHHIAKGTGHLPGLANYTSTQAQRNAYPDLARERLHPGASVSNFQDIKPCMVNNNNKPPYIRLNQNSNMMTHCEPRHLREPYENVMIPIRQTEQQYFERYTEMALENPQEEFDLNNFHSSDTHTHIPIQWLPQNLQFQRTAALQNQQRAAGSAQARLLNHNHTNNLSLVQSVPQTLNVPNYWEPEPLAAAENMSLAQQHLRLQNNHIQENNSNQFAQRKVFKRQRGRAARVQHNQFGLQTPQRKKFGQNRSHRAKVDVMNNAGYASFNGQRRGHRFVSYET